MSAESIKVCVRFRKEMNIPVKKAHYLFIIKINIGERIRRMGIL